jgi:hydroxyacylglutathione hydrolase
MTMAEIAEIIPITPGLLDSVAYLVRLEGGAILIDPSVPTKKAPDTLQKLQLILATHGHIDHIDQADAWRKKYSAPLAIHVGDQFCLQDASQNLSSFMGTPRSFEPPETLLEDEQVLPLDKHHDMRVMHTPGHTAGSCCFLLMEQDLPLALFTGDTLFSGSVGRTDLGGDPRSLTRSLKRLRRLADMLELKTKTDLIVYPGHGPSTYLLREIQTNPYF